MVVRRPNPSVAFVTVSYGPDRDRCALLSRSLDALAPSVAHWIVVDSADRDRFASLAKARRTVITTEDILPVWLRRLNLRKVGLRSNLWARGKPIRGWLVQQLVKLAVARGRETVSCRDSAGRSARWRTSSWAGTHARPGCTVEPRRRHAPLFRFGPRWRTPSRCASRFSTTA